MPPQGPGFVFLDVAGVSAPGVIVEQLRTGRGWRVLVAVVESEPDRTRSVSVRWVDPDRVRPARPS